MSDDGIYSVAWGLHGTVELRLARDLFAAAESGDVQARGKIVHRFKNKHRKIHGKRIDEHIGWDDQDFVITSVDEASSRSLSVAESSIDT